MDKFKHLTKAREKTLGLFSKVADRLYSLNEQIEGEILHANQNIKDLNEAVRSEEEAIEFLKLESSATQRSLSKVNEFLLP